MLSFVLKRFGMMVVTAICLTFIVFALTNLSPNLERLAKEQVNGRMSDEAVASWLTENGYDRPVVVRYAEWLGGFAIGDMGHSTRFDKPVSEIIGKRLGNTGWLMFWVMVTMVPMALLIGVLAGMNEGSKTDRSLSAFSIMSTATPEYVSGVILIAVFATSFGGLKWFKGTATSAEEAITFANFTLPVLTMALYGVGYIARMTRASMTEVMTSQYIRTARLKGVSTRGIVVKHALRNALIAPFTVIMLQFPWLLTGVVIVETLYNYKGFGWVLVEAAQNNDIALLLACSVVAVFVVLATQLISDIGYVYLNPRIRVR